MRWNSVCFLPLKSQLFLTHDKVSDLVTYFTFFTIFPDVISWKSVIYYFNRPTRVTISVTYFCNIFAPPYSAVRDLILKYIASKIFHLPLHNYLDIDIKMIILFLDDCLQILQNPTWNTKRFPWASHRFQRMSCCLFQKCERKIAAKGILFKKSLIDSFFYIAWHAPNPP